MRLLVNLDAAATVNTVAFPLLTAIFLVPIHLNIMNVEKACAFPEGYSQHSELTLRTLCGFCGVLRHRGGYNRNFSENVTRFQSVLKMKCVG